MEDENLRAATAMGIRHPRQGEHSGAKWLPPGRRVVSALGDFAASRGLAVSTFSLWRRELSFHIKKIQPSLAVIADEAFFVSNLIGEQASSRPLVATQAADMLPSRNRAPCITLDVASEFT